jgi:SAM-dependent methyltransferase
MASQLRTHTSSLPPDWALQPAKPAHRKVWDLLGAPLRMVVLPDEASERIGLTSLRAERMAAVLPELKGRVLDVGAGDNVLLKLYRRRAAGLSAARLADAEASVGVDVIDWGGGCRIVRSSAELPFPAASFDTVAFVACLNHIPERREALREAQRVLRPGGRVVATMIGRFIGDIGHRLWWYSEDKHRDVADGEVMGMNRDEVVGLLREAGFGRVRTRGFVYGLNTLYVAEG